MATTVKLTNVLMMVGHLLTLGTQCTFVSCVTITPQKKMLRAGCPFRDDLVKVAKRTGWLNMDYNRAVRRRLAAKLNVEVSQVEYVNGESWHRHILTGEGKATPVCVNKNKFSDDLPETHPDKKYYLFLTQGKCSNGRYIRQSTGEEIPYDEVKQWYYGKGEKDDFKPEVRCVTLNNVSELRVRGMIVRTNSTEAAEKILAHA